MLQIAIVVFREVLEIALILGILASSTKEIKGRSNYILAGLFLGIAISIALAFFTDQISNSLNGMGQEFFNGLILLASAFMIGWTTLWMQKHARNLSGELKRLGNSIKDGKKPLYALLVAVLFSVVREGTEIVLFTYSYFISGTKIYYLIGGLVTGIFCGSLVGIALYIGILKAFGKYFFTVTSWLLIFFASGIASAGIGFWQNAQIIPSLKNPAIDLSDIISQQSFLGKFLNIFLGYIDQPSGMQLLVYFSTLSILIIGLKIAKKI
jgi:high-affinity iron transporter